MPDNVELTAYTGDIQAVRRVADIIGLFSLETPHLTVAEAAQRVGMNRTTVHRYFNSMVTAGLLEREPNEPFSFGPGPLMLTLGAVAQSRRRVMDIAPHELRQLSSVTNLSAVLSLWGSSGPVVSLVSESLNTTILVTVRVGSQLGIESAQTRVFLALLPDQAYATAWLKNHPSPDPAELKKDLANVRAGGLCQVHIPAVDGVVLAAPVFDHHGIAATIAVIGTTTSFASNRSRTEMALIDTARSITKALGVSAP